jgi:O-methyltransferase involved in polyketide biosynthesis
VAHGNKTWGKDLGAAINTTRVSNVSDTARWVAVYRSWESARKDALFHDPYADFLAGERGKTIAALMPRQDQS